MRTATEKLLQKAERALRAARALLDVSDLEFAAGRAYYAMFYVAEALLYELDLSFSKHSAVHAAFGKEFAKTRKLDPKFHGWLLASFNARLQADYAFDILFQRSDVDEMVVQAQEFLDEARRYLQKN